MFFLAKFIRDKAAKLKKDGGGGESEKPFLEHLEDLRKTLFKIIITLCVVTIGTFIFNKPLLWVIQHPLYLANIPDEARKLMTLGAVEGMMLAIKVSFFAGIVLSFPLLMYFVGEFVMPGLKENEKRLILPSLTVGALLFATGLCFAYFVVIPSALEFFYGFSIARGWGYDLRAGYYISFAVQMILVFGISFELPVVVMGLVKLEILSHRVMRNTRSTAIVIMVIVSAVITPTTDVFTLSLLAGPLVVLYEICIWMAWWLEKKRAREERRERERALPEAQPMPDPPAPPAGAAGAGAAAAAPLVTPVPGRSEADKTAPSAPAYDPENEFKEDGAGSDPDISPGGEFSGAAETATGSQDEPLHGQDSATGEPVAEPGSEDETPADTGDEYWKDPYHYDHDHDYHHHEHDDYYSGPIEELKRQLREELTQQIKAEVREEVLQQLRKELLADAKPPRRISLDPRRTRRPR